MLKLEVELGSNVPIYIQISNQIRHLVATGELKTDDQLPTVRQVAADLRVNFNTVARAYRLLDEDRVISTQHGRGTFILTPVSAEDTTRLQLEDLRHLTLEYIQDAAQLGFSADELRKVFESFLEGWQSEGTFPEIDINKILGGNDDDK